MAIILDDSDGPSVFTETGPAWSGGSDGGAWNGEEAFDAEYPTQSIATWTTNQVQPGTAYVVQASWGSGSPNHCATAQYVVYDGTTLVTTVPANQAVAPVGPTYNGVKFATLTNITPTTNTITVTVTGNGCWGALVADAIRIAPPGSPPSAQFNGNPSSFPAGTNSAQVSFANQTGGTAPYTYSYDFGNTGTFQIANTSNATETIPESYVASPGTFAVRGRIMDSAGDYTDYSVNLTVGAQGYIVTPYLHIPDPGQNPTCVGSSPVNTSVGNGNWSNWNIWSLGHVPRAGETVLISPGTTITYDVNDSADSIALQTVEVQSGGKLEFSTGVSTQIFVTTVVVLQGGELDIGTQANPIPANLTAAVVWVNQALNTICDPEQYHHGLIVLGTMNTYGAAKPSYIALAQEPHAGDTMLHLSAPATGWQIGDKLQLPDSHQWNVTYNPAQWEQVTIQSMSPDNMTITLTTPLQFDHPGPHDNNGNVIADPTNNTPLLPHAVNITRNVDIHSQSAQGVRGIAIFTANANVNINYTAFTGMGRTTNGTFANSNFSQFFDNTTFNPDGSVAHLGANEQNRNAITFLDLIGPITPQANGYQYTFNGNVVICPLTPMPFVWGLNVVNSYYGLIENNDIVNWNGAGVVVDTQSSYNMFNGNFVMRITGTGGRGGADIGFGGDGFWMNTANNYLTGNFVSTLITGGTPMPTTTTAGFAGVAYTSAGSGGNGDAGAYGYAYEYYLMTGDSESNLIQLNPVIIAAYQGADPSQPGQFQTIATSALPILGFTNNTAYGNMPWGFSNWWTHYDGGTGPSGAGGTIEHFVAWNQYNGGYIGYQSTSLTDHNIVVACDYASGGDLSGAMSYQDYQNNNAVVDGGYFYNCGIGTPVETGTPYTVQNSTFVNAGVGITGLWGVGGVPTGSPADIVVLNNDKFISAGQTVPSIGMYYFTPFQNGINATTVPTNVTVTNYNGVQGWNFNVYYYETAANFQVQPSVYPSGGGTIIAAQDNNANPLGDPNDPTTWWTNAQLAGAGYYTVQDTGTVMPFTANIIWQPQPVNSWAVSGFTPQNGSNAFDGATVNPPFYGVGVPTP